MSPSAGYDVIYQFPLCYKASKGAMSMAAGYLPMCASGKMLLRAKVREEGVGAFQNVPKPGVSPGNPLFLLLICS